MQVYTPQDHWLMMAAKKQRQISRKLFDVQEKLTLPRRNKRLLTILYATTICLVPFQIIPTPILMMMIALFFMLYGLSYLSILDQTKSVWWLIAWCMAVFILMTIY